MSPKEGGCLCGQVRFRLLSDPLMTRVCWCRDCQRLASNGTVNAIVPNEAIEVSGTLQAFSSLADSGNTMRRRFCPTCGTQLFSDSSGRPGMTVVRVGTLDAPSEITPNANIWTSSAPRWACLDPALEQVERQPAAPQARPR